MTLQHLLKVPFKTLVYTVSQHNKHGKFYNYYLNNVLSHDVLCAMLSHLVMSDSLWPHGLRPSRLLCPWGISRQNCRGRLPFPSPGALPNPGMDRTLPALQVDSLLLSHQGSPKWYLNIPILVELRFFFSGLSWWLSSKELACYAGDGDTGSIRVGKSPWRSAWQLTPVFLPGDSHVKSSLVGYNS